MIEQAQTVIQNAPLWLQGLAVAATLLLLAGLILLAGGFFSQRRREDRRIRRAVRRMGQKILASVRVPDGLDGTAHIDYLVLKPNEIIVIGVKRHTGHIYAGELLDEWTQVVGGSNHRFPNPLKEMEFKLHALKLIAPDVPFKARVFFTESCQFPRNKPDGVLLAHEVSRQPGKQSVPATLESAWLKLAGYKV